MCFSSPQQTNPHCLTLVMNPDESFEKQRQEKEEQRLQQAVSALSERDRELVYQKGGYRQAVKDRAGLEQRMRPKTLLGNAIRKMLLVEKE